jgi:REP element-mobilizing transposase RayT/DNA-binding transcriptional ArsR family regulator
MPRRPRLHVPGGLFHIVLRGNGHQDIFFDDEDRRLWEQFLQAGLNRYSHRIHAYCWMTNHVHMAIQAHTIPLARFVGTLASRYAKAINKKLGRSGHLFERRYRPTIVQAESYLKELVRYIHLNPVRAGMVNEPVDYPWSSHIDYLGSTPPPWLTRDWVLAAFGPTEKSARQSYAKFMQETQSDSVMEEFRASPNQDDRVLGDDGFLASMARAERSVPAIETLDQIVLNACRRHCVTEADLASPSLSRLYARIRAEIALEALERGVSSVTEVARRFGRSQPSLSRTMSRLRDRRAKR